MVLRRAFFFNRSLCWVQLTIVLKSITCTSADKMVVWIIREVSAIQSPTCVTSQCVWMQLLSKSIDWSPVLSLSPDILPAHRMADSPFELKLNVGRSYFLRSYRCLLDLFLSGIESERLLSQGHFLRFARRLHRRLSFQVRVMPRRYASNLLKSDRLTDIGGVTHKLADIRPKALEAIPIGLWCTLEAGPLYFPPDSYSSADLTFV
jgi:hypothetical protein